MYSIVIQLGAVLTLPIYFWHRFVKLHSSFPKGERGDRTLLTHPLSLVLLAFVVTSIPSLLLIKIIGKHLESPYVIGSSLLIGGIIMWIVDELNSASETAGWGRPGHRFCGFVYCCVRLGCVVYGLGEATWICPVRGVPDRRGCDSAGVGVRGAALSVLETRSRKVFDGRGR